MNKLLVLCLITALTALSNITVTGADSKPAPAEKKASKHIPFHGKADAVDKNAKTIKVGERTFHVTSDTKITKAGKPAHFEEATVGEDVAGAYHEGEGGTLELMSLRIGPKPAKEDPKEEKK
jgi:hypothetical protein